MTVRSFIDELKAKRDAIPFVPEMEADELDVTGGDTLPITADVYALRLDFLPPRWMHQNAFAYGEGGDAFHLFWQDCSGYYVLRMTDQETDAFCAIAGIRRFI